MQSDGRLGIVIPDRQALLVSWYGAAKTLAIGPRKGELSGMPKNRTLRMVVVRQPGHGAGLDTEKNPDAKVEFGGKAVRVSAN